MALSGLLAAPSPDELHHLVRLCGSEDRVIALLAKTYGLSAETIAPTVLEWIAALPPLVPPSRQRSAPPALAPSVAAPVVIAGRPRGPDILPIKTPPASAPVRSSAELTAAMKAINTRLNHTAQATNSERKSLANAPSQRVELDARLKLLPPTVPEDAPLADPMLRYQEAQRQRSNMHHDRAADDAALAAYMERHTMLHGSGLLAPGRDFKRSGGWNYS